MKNNPANALAQAQQSLALTESQIADAQQQRQVLLPDGDPAQIVKLNRLIADLRESADIFRERAVALSAQIEIEKEEERKRAYTAACVALDGPLDKLNKVARRLERNDAERAALVSEFKGEVRSVLKSWPETVEWPDRVYPPGYISTAPLGERYRDALGPDLRNKFSHQAPLVGEWVERHSRTHLDGFGSEIARQNADLSEALRTAHDEPAPVETEEEAA